MTIVRLVMRDGTVYQVDDPFPVPPGKPLKSQKKQKIGQINFVPRTVSDSSPSEWDAHYELMSVNFDIETVEPEPSDITYQIELDAKDVLYPVREAPMGIQLAIVHNRRQMRLQGLFDTAGLPRPEEDEDETEDETKPEGEAAAASGA